MQLGWLTHASRGSARLCISYLVLGLQAPITMSSFLYVHIQTQVFMSACQVLYPLSHLPGYITSLIPPPPTSITLKQLVF